LEKTIKVLFVSSKKVELVSLKEVCSRKLSFCSCKTVSSVSEAKKVLKEEKFDVILSDYLLDDGTVKDILKITDIPVIVITSEGNEEIAVECFREGVSDYIIKDREEHYLKLLPAVISHVVKESQKEKKIRELTERYEKIFRFSPEIISLIDRNGIILEVNERIKELLGYKPEEVIGRKFYETTIFSQETLKFIKERFKRRLKGEEVDSYTVKFRTKSGEEKIGKVIASLIKDKNGKVEGEIGIITDITEELKLKEEIRKREELFRGLAENSLVGVYIFDEKKFLYVNPAFCEIFKCKREDVIWKKGPLEFTHPEDRETVAENIRKRMSGEMESAHYIFRGLRCDGKSIWVEALGRAIEYYGRKVVMGTIMDITQRKKYEEKLKEEHIQIEKTLNGTIYAISKLIEVKDPYTAGHQVRVAKLSEAIAKELGMESDKIKTLIWACLLHDIGKINVPSEILTKPRKLSDVEFSIIKTHPIVAYNILREINALSPVAQIILQHHERIDGSGYPSGLKEKDILFEAKIIAVADTIEAMISHRPYRPAFKIEEALEEIEKNKGIKYDPVVVEACVKLIKEKKFSFED